MRASLCTLSFGLLLVGCALEQAGGVDGALQGDDGGDGGETGDVTGTPVTDEGDDEGDAESGIGDDGGGCVDVSDCPPGNACVGGLCVGDMCPEGEVCEPDAVCRAGAIDCSSGTAVCAVVGNAPVGAVCDAGYVCDPAGECVPCVDGAECDAPAECSVGTIACGDGDPECTATDWAPEGTPCTDDRYCNDTGVCLTALDCATIRSFDAAAVSGIYPIDPDGPGGDTPITAYCDFDTGDGGWSLWDSAEVDELPSNAAMPRCGPGGATDCYAGTFAGRGDAPGLYRVTAITERLQDDLGWATVEVEQEHLGDCTTVGSTCMAGEDQCLFSLIGEGNECCTATNMNNMCLQ